MDQSTATTYTPNPLNQYASIVTGGTTFTPLHDADGNLVNDGIRTYLWDGENRLEEVRRVSDNALIARYSYDYMSRRVYKATTSAAPQGATATVFMYDGWNLLAEYPAIHRSIASTTPAKRTYTWGLDLSGSLQGAGGVGGLLAVEEKASTSGQVRYPLYDGNGNVVGVDDGISAAAVYEYDAFGNTVYQADGYADEMPFRFSTKYFDKETGFYYYGYRFYDPVTGRWPSRDPIWEKGGVNLHGFLANNSIDAWDYLGLIDLDTKPSIKEVLADCTKKLEAANNQKAVIDIRAAMKLRGCPEPVVTCENCCQGSPYESKFGGFYRRDKAGRRIAVCANNNVHFYTGNLVSIDKLVHHEWIHAWQDCSNYAGGYPASRDGDKMDLPVGDPNRCRRSVCWEIQAYSNADAAGLDPEQKKIRVRRGVLASSRPHCGKDLGGLKKLEALFNELYETCSKPLDLKAN